jgi:hypothetical protein
MKYTKDKSFRGGGEPTLPTREGPVQLVSVQYILEWSKIIFLNKVILAQTPLLTPSKVNSLYCEEKTVATVLVPNLAD